MWQQLAMQAGLALGQSYLDKRAQDRAFEQNKQFWHERFDKEAQYNSPVQQKARMMQAGLNPALMYKGGQTGGNVSGGSAQGNIAEKYQLTELARMSAEVQKIKADTEKTDAEKSWIVSKTEGQATSNEIAIQDLGIKTIDRMYASKMAKNKLKNQMMDWINKVQEFNMKQEQTEYWKQKSIEARTINYEWYKLQKELIDQGVDRDAPLFQSGKQYLMTSGIWKKFTGKIKQISWENFINPETDIFGNKANWVDPDWK